MSAVVNDQEVSGYGDGPKYWNKRYAVRETFEWYQSYKDLVPYITSHVPDEAHVLHIGIGNSPFSRDMHEARPLQTHHCIDISPVVVAQMQESFGNDRLKCEGVTGACVTGLVSVETMDCTKMTFADEMFDNVIDKGTLDAIMCGSDAAEVAHQYLLEAQRVMKPRGKLIVISCACLVCMCVCELHGRAAHVAATIPGLPPASPAVRPTTDGNGDMRDEILRRVTWAHFSPSDETVHFVYILEK